jgi:polyisoprenyl-teichoic acid--peptidoglycan teichoic acid transferase
MRRSLKAKPRWKKVMGVAAYGTFLLAVFAIAVAAGWIRSNPFTAEILKQAVAPKEPEKVFQGDYLTLLILGCDQDLTYRGKQVIRKYARSDMMMVVKLDFKTNQITGISIPRDMEVQLPGYSRQKINAYHAIGRNPEQQADLARRAAEHLLPGVRIQRVVTLDFDAFQELVDLVGGVPVDVERRMKYTDRAAKLVIDLQPGPQLLDGYNAMGFVRYRHADSDFHRQERQKQFMAALKGRVLESDPVKIPSILEQAKDVLNNALTNEELASLVHYARQVPPENVRMGVVPYLEQRGSTNLLVDLSKLNEVLFEYQLVPAYQVQRSN